MDLCVGHYLSFILFFVNLASCSKNVLLLIADDFRPEIGAYYQSHAYVSRVHPNLHTPNIDKLASKGILFKQAHVQQALCCPSRASFLTGRRPDTTRVYDLYHDFRKSGGNFTTIPEFFKLNGYTSVGMGKIFHPTGGNIDLQSWSTPFFQGRHYHEDNNNIWKALPDSQLQTQKLIDQQVADHAVQTLNHLAPGYKHGNNPFFMAVGFRKPHLPFVFPDSFLQYYPESQVHLPNNQFAPVNMPDISWSAFNELRNYKDFSDAGPSGTINTTIPGQTTLQLRRGYYSAVSYMDSLVGQVVDSLDHLGLANDTIIAFIGDHGWQLGEHGEWAKHTNFQLATHTPMIIRVPGRTDAGIHVNHVTEFVDLFPTLVEAAGFDALPVCPEDSSNVRLCTEGLSLLPFIDQPTHPLKRGAFSQFMRHGGNAMGYSIKTYKYRYTEWVDFRTGTPDWSQVIAREFYDHTTDPDENYNNVDDPSNANKIQYLSKRLHGGWRDSVIHHDNSPIIG